MTNATTLRLGSTPDGVHMVDVAVIKVDIDDLARVLGSTVEECNDELGDYRLIGARLLPHDVPVEFLRYQRAASSANETQVCLPSKRTDWKARLTEVLEALKLSSASVLWIIEDEAYEKLP